MIEALTYLAIVTVAAAAIVGAVRSRLGLSWYAWFIVSAIAALLLPVLLWFTTGNITVVIVIAVVSIMWAVLAIRLRDKPSES